MRARPRRLAVSSSHEYQLCGWRVRSAVAVPELLAWEGGTAQPVDVDIRVDAVPEQLAGAVVAVGMVQIAADGTALVHVPDLVRILVRGGREITVQILRQERQASGWRLFLLGIGLALLCDQRGLYPLHAACLRIDGRIVAFAGVSGAGKSSLALALSRRGHALQSDDLTVLRDDGAAGITVLPAYPRLKLWRETLDWAHMPAAGLTRVRPALEKYDLAPMAGFVSDAAPLDALVVLEAAGDDRVLLEAVEPAAAVPMVLRHATRRGIRRQAGRMPILFEQSAAIVRAVPVFRLIRPLRFEWMEATVEAVERMVAGLPASGAGEP